MKIYKLPSNNLPFNEKLVKGSWEMNTQHDHCKSIPRKDKVPSTSPPFLSFTPQLFN